MKNIAQHWDSFGADKRLAALGWSKKDWLEILDAAVGARRSTTALDVLPAGGSLSWIIGTRHMRTLGIPKGMIVQRPFGIESIYDPERRNHFVFQNADAGTGRRNQKPKNLHPKGTATQSTIWTQGELFRRGVVEDTFWFFLVFCQGKDVRCELSSPISCDGSGFFEDYAERIFIFEGATGSGSSSSSDDVEPDDPYEVEIRRKA